MESKTPENTGYYIGKTPENKYGIVYWDGQKWWDDPNQDGKLSFGLKHDWIVEWYPVPTSESTLIAERDSLKKFKKYTHDRLDGMGVEKEPNGEHGASGCRIGDRMDIIESFIAEHRLMKEALEYMSKNPVYPYAFMYQEAALETLKNITL